MTTQPNVPANYEQLQLWPKAYHDSLITLPECSCEICTLIRPIHANPEYRQVKRYLDFIEQEVIHPTGKPRSLRVSPPKIPASVEERWVSGYSDETYCDEDD